MNGGFRFSIQVPFKKIIYRSYLTAINGESQLPLK